MTDDRSDWRLLGGVATAWFDAPSSAAGAALAGRVVHFAPDAAVDVRAGGVRVRLEQTGPAAPVPAAVSAAARDLGLTGDPAVLQHLGVVIESPDPAAVRPFWRGVLGYEPTAGGDLADPLRRDPDLRLRRSAVPRPLRGRVHLDVVRPAAVVDRVSPGEPAGPYGVRHADPDGNEVDLVPGGTLDERPATADWHTVFGAVACYRTPSTTLQQELVAAATCLADDVGFPLLVDLRPGRVVLDSGKDRWEADAHGLDVDFADLAAEVQAAARGLGAVADPALPRFVQLFLDAADVEAARGFWLAALGYARDRRPGVSDIHDPRRLGPELVFQELDATDTARRRQRDRVHLELAVPAEQAPTRVSAALAAGGRLLLDAEDRWLLVDPEGNELVVHAG